MNKVELIGIVASILVLISMCVRSYTYKGAMFMRIANLVGAVIFVVYGLLLPAYSTAILNAALVVVNIGHIRKLHKHKDMLNS